MKKIQITFDLLFQSLHGDYDHIGNATYLVDNFKVKNVYFNYDPYDDLEESLKLKLNQKNKLL